MCQTPHCPDFHQSGRDNVRLKKLYGPEQRRLLRCRTCGTNFSETKGTPYWGSKLSPARVDSIVDHLTHGNCFSSTASLTGCHRTTVARIMRQAGVHLQQFHNQHARDLKVTSMQADERHSFVGEKAEQAWDFTVVDPRSKFVIEGQVGTRTTELTKILLIGAKERLAAPQNLVLFTDGYLPYQSLFPELFGTAWQPPRQGKRGRFPQQAYRIPRRLAHVRIIKEYSGKRVVGVRTEVAAGTQKRVNQELQSLGYTTPNTSAVERQNGTARRMNPHLARKSLAFARLPLSSSHIGWAGSGRLQLVQDAKGTAPVAGKASRTTKICSAHTSDGDWVDFAVLDNPRTAQPALWCCLSVIVPANYPGLRTEQTECC